MKIEVMLDHRTILENRRSTIFFALEFQAPKGPVIEGMGGAYVFVLDRSVSMSGEPFKMGQRAIQFLIRHLPRNAQLAFVIFDEAAELILPLTQASDKGAFRLMVDQLEPSNAGSNVSAAWLLACEELQTSAGPRRILLFTDGEHTAGIRDEKVLADLAAQGAKQGIRTSTFQASGGNAPLLEEIARAGQGGFHPNCGGEQLAAIVEKELGGLLPTVAQNVRLRINPSSFCDQIEALGMHHDLKSGAGGQIEVGLGDFLAEELRSACFNLEVQPLPCIDGEACASLEGESLLQVEAFYDEITTTGVVLRRWQQDVLVQAAQPAANIHAAVPLILFSEGK
jgi:Ca-activated chloride channel family protein